MKNLVNSKMTSVKLFQIIQDDYLPDKIMPSFGKKEEQGVVQKGIHHVDTDTFISTIELIY